MKNENILFPAIDIFLVHCARIRMFFISISIFILFLLFNFSLEFQEICKHPKNLVFQGSSRYSLFLFFSFFSKEARLSLERVKSSSTARID